MADRIASVYNTECVYDPHSDHRRKGVYSQKIDSLKVGDSTLQILIEAILNASEDEVSSVVRKIRTCDSLDKVAEQLLQQQESDEEDVDDGLIEDNDINDDVVGLPVQGERELARKMGEMRLENGAVRFIGGTSHLVYAGDPHAEADSTVLFEDHMPSQNPITTWTRVTQDEELISHLMDMCELAFTGEAVDLTNGAKTSHFTMLTSQPCPGPFSGATISMAIVGLDLGRYTARSCSSMPCLRLAVTSLTFLEPTERLGTAAPRAIISSPKQNG